MNGLSLLIKQQELKMGSWSYDKECVNCDNESDDWFNDNNCTMMH